MSTGTKICTRCKERLHMSAFRRRVGTDTHEAACMPCRKARQQELKAAKEASAAAWTKLEAAYRERFGE